MESWLFVDYSRGLVAVGLLLIVLVVMWFLLRWRREFPLQAAAGVGVSAFSIFFSHLVYLHRVGLLADINLWPCGCGYDRVALWLSFVVGVLFLFIGVGRIAVVVSALSLSIALLLMPIGVSPILPIAVAVISYAGRWFGLFLVVLNFWTLYGLFNVKIESEGWVYVVALLPIMTLFIGGRFGERNE